MAKKDQSIMDSIVNDIANTIALKGAVEATRDENGKVDKWAATGLAMGLGYTSDDDFATLSGILGAEGAFDNDTDSIPYNFDDNTYIPAGTQSYTQSTQEKETYMDEAEYLKKKEEIISSAKAERFGYIFVILLTIAFPLIATCKGISVGWGGWLITFGIIAFFLWGVKNESDIEETELRQLENKYTEAKKKKAEAEEIEKKTDQTFEELKSYSGTDNYSIALNEVSRKAEDLFNKACEAYNIDDNLFNANSLFVLLISTLYSSIDTCPVTQEQKSEIFDLTLSLCGIKCDVTGRMLFLEPNNYSLTESLDNVFFMIFEGIHRASAMGPDHNAGFDLVKTLCSLILLLGDEVEKAFSETEYNFGRNGSRHIISTALASIEKLRAETSTSK